MTLRTPAACGLFLSLACASPLLHASQPPIVVEDRGGASALPYYEALNLQPRPLNTPRPAIVVPQPPTAAVDESAMLPVRSARLSPGTVARRVLEAPGLQPFFLVGDDDASRAWLRRHAAALRERNAAGLVVNVGTPQALAQLRALAPGIALSPAAADDLAGRLGLWHYPALITATGIEQ